MEVLGSLGSIEVWLGFGTELLLRMGRGMEDGRLSQKQTNIQRVYRNPV